MHDGLSFTKQEVIQRHAGQAAPVTASYNALSAAEQRQLLAFLDSSKARREWDETRLLRAQAACGSLARPLSAAR